MNILDGKLVSEKIRSDVKEKISEFVNEFKRSPHLAVLIIGNDQASQVYVRNKVRACESVGMRSSKIELASSITQEMLIAEVKRLNQDNSIDGILVQLPLPKHLNEMEVNEIIHPLKDVDGFSFVSLGKLFASKPVVVPCTPNGVMEILKYYKISVAGKKAVVIGRSNIVGKPMAQLLLMADATVTICHSRTNDIRQFTKTADIVVVAIGKKHFFGKEDFKDDAIVIDVGMHGSGLGGSLAGDVRFEEFKNTNVSITPVPGGVGPMTISMLLSNTVHLAHKRLTNG